MCVLAPSGCGSGRRGTCALDRPEAPEAAAPPSRGFPARGLTRLRIARRRSSISVSNGASSAGRRAITTKSAAIAGMSVASERIAPRRRRRIRLRSVAWPTRLVMVSPRCTPSAGLPSRHSSDARRRPWTVMRSVWKRRPDAAARKSARRRSLEIVDTAIADALRARGADSGRELLPAVSAARGDDLAAAGGGHAGAETVAALPHELARLVGSLHRLDLKARMGPGRPTRGAPLASTPLGKGIGKRETRPSRALSRSGAAYGGWPLPSQTNRARRERGRLGAGARRFNRGLTFPVYEMSIQPAWMSSGVVHSV